VEGQDNIPAGVEDGFPSSNCFKRRVAWAAFFFQLKSIETAGPGITISVTQECQIALPPRTSRIPEVNVTVTSQCPGVSAQVIVSANFNTPDGSYQTTVGSGQFTTTKPQVQVRFTVALRLSRSGRGSGGRLGGRSPQRHPDI
jgi:hypothetical protein